MELHCRLSHVSVCMSVWKVYCSKTADCIRMPFGMLSGVGGGMGVVEVHVLQGEGTVLGVLAPIGFNGVFV